MVSGLNKNVKKVVGVLVKSLSVRNKDVILRRFGLKSGKRETLEFIGYEQETERNYSDKIAFAIDQETENFIKQAQETAKKTLTAKKKLFEKVANILVAKESIEKEERLYFHRFRYFRGFREDQ